MRFDLTDLALILHVQEAGTITAGAARLHMTLASASERIRGMEAVLGVPLLTRGRRGVALTPAGLALAHHARAVLLQMERMRGELADYGRGLKGHVRLLGNTAAISEHLPELLADFLARHPRVSVDLEERTSYDIADAVRRGLCDIGVVADSADLQGLQAHAFRPDPLVLVVPAGHALARRRTVSLAEAAHLDFVGLAQGSALQEHVSHHARRAGRTLSYRVRLPSFEAVCRMVGQGIGVSVVPRAAAKRHGRTAGIRPVALRDGWAARSLLVCVRDAHALPLHAQQMLRHLLAPPPAPRPRKGAARATAA